MVGTSVLDSKIISTKLLNTYIILLVSDIFEQTPKSNSIVLVLLWSNFSHRVFDQIIINVQLIDQVVYVKPDAKTKRQPSLQRRTVKVKPLEYCCEDNVHQSNLMNFVDKGIEFANMFFKQQWLMLVDAITYYQKNPTHSDESYD